MSSNIQNSLLSTNMWLLYCYFSHHLTFQHDVKNITNFAWIIWWPLLYEHACVQNWYVWVKPGTNRKVQVSGVNRRCILTAFKETTARCDRNPINPENVMHHMKDDGPENRYDDIYNSKLTPHHTGLWSEAGSLWRYLQQKTDAYTHTHTYIHIHIHIQIHIHIYNTHTGTYTHIHTNIYTHHPPHSLHINPSICSVNR